MRVSLNEIEVTLKKATMGAGYAIGLAEDMGRACYWLAERGYDAAGAGLAALQSHPDGGQGRLDAGGCLRYDAARVVCDGPSGFDLLIAGDATSVELAGMDAPLLLIGLAGIAAAAYGGAWRLDHAGGAIIVSGEGVGGGTIPVPGDNIRLTRLKDAPASRSTRQTGGCDVADQDWSAITALAARLLVPESAASRQAGAGAGAIDND